MLCKRELKQFLKHCRRDMHEPEEDGVSAIVVGDHLDNALGNRVIESLVIAEHQEYIVVLKKDDGEKMLINLADLIALAMED